MSASPIGNGNAAGHRARLRAWADRVLTDRLMIELALLLIPATVLPLVFNFSPVLVIAFQVVNYVIIAVFAFEYVMKLYAAESRVRFFLDPWHLLDLGIIVLAGLDFSHLVKLKGGKASPLLRLLRVARVFAVTGRALKRVHVSPPTAPKPSPAPLEINVREEGKVKLGVTWDEAVASVLDPSETWIDVQGVTPADLARLSETFRVPGHVLESKLFKDVFPSVDYFTDYTILVAWDTRLVSAGEGADEIQTENPPVVIICARGYLATLSTGRNCLFEHLGQQGLPLADETFSVRVLYAILQHKIGDYKAAIHLLEKRVADLEEVPIGHTPPNFLEDTFRLKKVIQKQDYNLRHFNHVLEHLQSRKVVLQKIRDESLDLFVLLHDESATLNDTCHSIRDDLLALIELQMNRVSFNLNHIMRVLAIISCLSLIPAVIGGLLGENLVDQPYQVTIHEVFFVVISLMLGGLYFFYRMGWLRR